MAQKSRFLQAFNPDAPYELFLDHPTAGRYTIDLHQQVRKRILRAILC
jgi:hypothetical protein